MLRRALVAVAVFAVTVPVFSIAVGSGSRAVVNLPDGRLLAVVGGTSQSLSSRNGMQRIVADGIVIEMTGRSLTVDGEPRELPAFERLLEIRIVGGTVVLVGDP